ncbi:MAG TPA: Uma2 family endonuclease [Nodosilinea sp.]|nr:Uma2 family endonuclease [Nodosilinea sp.]
MALSTTAAPFTFEDYVAYDDGSEHRYELVDGVLVAMTPPTFRHMLIAKFIEQRLDAEIARLGLGWFCFQEAGVRTGVRKSRLTDVYVLTPEQVSGLMNRAAIAETPPLLAVEVVSPDSITRDYRYKRTEYAALEIPEYWIVDPLESRVTVLVFDEGLYDETVFEGDQALVSPTFPALALTVAQILAAGELP